jgi:aminobenzoyl-glutamate utilization protein B
VFNDVDAVLYAHVGPALTTSWGDSGGSGLVSVEYSFTGESSHAAAAPWLGRSALDAVELMNIGWNYRREHLRLAQRSHYVITNGGDQPNVVPPAASVWYYFRENDYARIKSMWEAGDAIARGAAMMTATTVNSRVLGSAWPGHGNRALAEAMYANIKTVGAPPWSAADQQFARAVQRSLGVPERGLITDVSPTLQGAELLPESQKMGGPSDDIGDVMWSVPTVTLMFPSNIGGTTPHNWTAAIAMATPIAHKGATQGAKVHAMTTLDLMTRPELVKAARDYFQNVQGKQATYQPLIRPEDKPAIWLNKETMERFRPELRKFYYDPTRYSSYLEQLGVPYPNLAN